MHKGTHTCTHRHIPTRAFQIRQSHSILPKFWTLNSLPIAIVFIESSGDNCLPSIYFHARSSDWTERWNRLSSLCPASVNSWRRNQNCEYIIPRRGMSRAARSMTSSCVPRTSLMKWTGRRNFEVSCSAWTCSGNIQLWASHSAWVEAVQEQLWCCPPLNIEDFSISVYGPNLRALDGLCSCGIWFDWPRGHRGWYGVPVWVSPCGNKRDTEKTRSFPSQDGSLALRKQTGTPVPGTSPIFPLME